jgi:hypothetical protein
MPILAEVCTSVPPLLTDLSSSDVILVATGIRRFADASEQIGTSPHRYAPQCRKRRLRTFYALRAIPSCPPACLSSSRRLLHSTMMSGSCMRNPSNPSIRRPQFRALTDCMLHRWRHPMCRSGADSPSRKRRQESPRFLPRVPPPRSMRDCIRMACCDHFRPPTLKHCGTSSRSIA